MSLVVVELTLAPLRNSCDFQLVPDSSVGLKMLGKYFPPWTVTCETWHAVLRPGVSGIATDAMLFHQHGHRLVHRYRIYKDLYLMCPCGEQLYEN